MYLYAIYENTNFFGVIHTVIQVPFSGFRGRAVTDTIKGLPKNLNYPSSTVRDALNCFL